MSEPEFMPLVSEIEKKSLKPWVQNWLETHGKQPYYMYYVHHKSNIRLQFYNKKTKNVETITRSTAKYGMKLARNKLFEEFQKRTGYKEKLQPLPTKKVEQEKLQQVNFYKDTSDLPLHSWFDIDTGFSVICLAKSKSGKTTLFSKIYNEILKSIFPITFLSSGSISADIYKNFKKTLKMTSFNSKLAQMCYTIQKHTKSKYKFLFMADDMDKDDRYANTLSNLFTKWRNYNISSIFMIQDPTMLTPTMRGNTNYFFIGNVGSEKLDQIVQMLYPFLAKSHQTKTTNIQEIQKLIKLATKDYGFIVLDNLNQVLYLPEKIQHLI